MQITTFYDHLKAAAGETGLPLEKIGEEALRHGITAFEAPFHQKDEEGIRRLRAAGMRVCGMPVHCDLLHDPSLSFARQVIAGAQQLEAEVILIIPGDFASGDDRQRLREASLKPIEYIARAAQAAGMAAGMEDFDGAFSANLGTAGVKWYLERVPHLTCVLDTGNFIYAGEDALAAYQSLKPFVTRQVHCKDRGLSGRPGEAPLVCQNGASVYPAAAGRGFLPIKEIVGDLALYGFDGSLTVEVYGSVKVWEDVLASAEYLKSCIP